MPRYSNDDGTIQIPVNDGIFPQFLPLGWQWISKWEIDLSDTYGNVDKEQGWGYAASFENLIECTKTKTLSGEVGRLSIVRRRRWIRYRECVTAESKKEFNERISWISLLSNRVSKINSDKTEELISINNFEKERKVAYDKLLSTAERCLQESVSTLEGVVEKLNLMKQFLIERGKLELDYANKLKQLANKWVHAGIPKNNIPKINNNNNNNNNNDDDDKSSNPGFFYVISASNNAVASRLQDFATLLSVSLPQDVSSVANDVDIIHESCLKEGPRQWCILKAKEEMSLKALTTFQRILENNRKQTLEEVAQLETELFMCHAIQQNGISDSITVNQDNINNNNCDCAWLAMQKYKRSVVELRANLLIYNAFAVQQKTEALKTSSRVASLLHATIKILAHEQSRLWEESALALKTLSKSQRSKSPDTTYNTVSKKSDTSSSPNMNDNNNDDEDDMISEDSTNVEIQKGTEELNNVIFPTLNQKVSIAYRGNLEYCIAPPSLQKKIASSRMSFATLPILDWKSIDIIVTYDKFMHIYESNTDEYDWIGDESLHSINLKCYSTSPLIVPITEKDCFILQPRKNNWVSRKYDVFIFRVKDAITSRIWLNIISSPYHDPSLDPPSSRLETEKLKKFIENHVDPGSSIKGTEL